MIPRLLARFRRPIVTRIGRRIDDYRISQMNQEVGYGPATCPRCGTTSATVFIRSDDGTDLVCLTNSCRT